MKTNTLLAFVVLTLAALGACDGSPGGRPPLTPADIDESPIDCSVEHRCGAP